MSPSVERSDPPYVQIVSYIRTRIESGELAADDLVPSAREISATWEVSLATATKALARLRSEGFVRGVPGVGTLVNDSQVPKQHRLAGSRNGRIYRHDEYAQVRSAELVAAPEQVADALGIVAGAPAIRRERLTFRGESVVAASTSWFDGSLAKNAPLLLQTERIKRGTPRYIEEATSRRMTSGRDQRAAGAATEQESEDLGVPVGAPVLRGRNWVYDRDGGVLEYGESVAASGRWSTYDYEIP